MMNTSNANKRTNIAKFVYSIVRSKKRLMMMAMIASFICWNVYIYSIVDSLKDFSRNVTVVQIYGSFYKYDLLEGFEADLVNCPELRCKALRTNNKTDSDAVVVHYNDLGSFAHGEQNYNKTLIIASWEPPYVTAPQINIDRLRNYKLMVISYRRESDVFVPYGSRVMLPNPVALDGKRIRSEFDSRLKRALVVISNCNSDNSIRMDYIETLTQEFPVDGFGKCFEGEIEHSRIVELYKKYMFTLAIESQYCKDYVTEKYWNPIEFGSIPVVFGGDDYTLALPNSFIKITDYDSPAKLGSFLNKVSTDFDEYKKYFAWKSTYSSVDFPRIKVSGCKVCKSLIKMPKNTSTIHKLELVSSFGHCTDRNALFKKYMK